MSAAAFEGFAPAAFRFFDQLAEHNDRDWFQAHRAVYESSCRAPMLQLLAALGANPTKAKVSRIHRDLRFSADKSPYKTYIAAGFDGNYLSLSASGVYVAAGLYDPQRAALQRYRYAVDDDGTGRALVRLLGALRRQGFEVNTHEGLKRVPSGYDPQHPRADLLRMKGLYAGRSVRPNLWRSPGEGLAAIRRGIEQLAPLNRWIRERVGPRDA